MVVILSEGKEKLCPARKNSNQQEEQKTPASQKGVRQKKLFRDNMALAARSTAVPIVVFVSCLQKYNPQVL